ncbi:MAG TPA: hypothetical protein VFZ61_03735 [Polyangiales bacterium]
MNSYDGFSQNQHALAMQMQGQQQAARFDEQAIRIARAAYEAHVYVGAFGDQRELELDHHLLERALHGDPKAHAAMAVLMSRMQKLDRPRFCYHRSTGNVLIREHCRADELGLVAAQLCGDRLEPGDAKQADEYIRRAGGILAVAEWVLKQSEPPAGAGTDANGSPV